MSIKIENVEVTGWEHVIRGMRNPKNSWEKSDSSYCLTYSCDECDNFSSCNPNDEDYFKRFWNEDPYNTHYAIGPNDHQLMMSLAAGGPVHAKYRRMITVYLDITGPLYWWKEFDTYKVGTVANSCSTMHKIHEKEFTLEDFSCEHLMESRDYAMAYSSDEPYIYDFCNVMKDTVDALNFARRQFLATKEKQWWWQMIQLLPSSYNQRRTVMLNYEVLAGMYESRRLHKLDEWREFCKWIESLPYSEIIIGEKSDES